MKNADGHQARMRRVVPCRTCRGLDASRRVASIGECGHVPSWVRVGVRPAGENLVSSACLARFACKCTNPTQGRLPDATWCLLVRRISRTQPEAATPPRRRRRREMGGQATAHTKKGGSESSQIPTLLLPTQSTYSTPPSSCHLYQGTEPPMGTGDGDDPRSPANRGWCQGWTPDPRQIGGGVGGGPPIPGKSGVGPPPPIPGKSGMGMGMGIGGSVP